jgi:hypothetical protein
VVILSGVDCPASTAEAFGIGARGYIPTASTTVELAVAIMRLVRAGGTFVPQASLSLRGTNPRGAAPQTITTHRFTPRHMEEANKIIADELEVSGARFSLLKIRGCSANSTLRSGSAICRSLLAARRLQGKVRRRASQISSSMTPRRLRYRATISLSNTATEVIKCAISPAGLERLSTVSPSAIISVLIMRRCGPEKMK